MGLSIKRLLRHVLGWLQEPELHCGGPEKCLACAANKQAEQERIYRHLYGKKEGGK